MRFKIDLTKILPMASITLGLLFAWVGLSSNDFWHPVRGFTGVTYPTIMAIALVVLGIIDLVRSYRDTAPVFEKRNWLLVLTVVAVVMFSYVVGLLASLGIFMLLWLKIVEKRPWKSCIIVMLVMAAITYVIFIWWLQVPFEQGLFRLIAGR